MGSDGNLMPFSRVKTLFPMTLKEKLEMFKSSSSVLKTCNKDTILQLSICIITITNKDEHKVCKFFVVPGNGPALLGA